MLPRSTFMDHFSGMEHRPLRPPTWQESQELDSNSIAVASSLVHRTKNVITLANDDVIIFRKSSTPSLEIPVTFHSTVTVEVEKNSSASSSSNALDKSNSPTRGTRPLSSPSSLYSYSLPSAATDNGELKQEYLMERVKPGSSKRQIIFPIKLGFRFKEQRTFITSENGGKEETLDQVYEVEQMECPNATVLDIETPQPALTEAKPVIKTLKIKEVPLKLNASPYNCPHCGRKYVNKYKYANHLYEKLGIPPYSCVKCNAGFLKKRELNLHRCSSQAKYPLIQSP